MPRKPKAWLSFNGIESDEVGAWLMSAPVFSKAPARGTSKSVIGRDGDVFVTGGAHDTQDIKVTMRCHLSHVGGVLAWLSGSGALLFSWARDRAYQARVEKKIDAKFAAPGGAIPSCSLT